MTTIQMTDEPDWDLLARYFLPEDEIVDFQYELEGRQTYRRDQDLEPPPRAMDASSSLSQCLRLLDGLDGVHQTRRPDGVDCTLRPHSSPRQETETLTPMSVSSSSSPHGPVQRVQKRKRSGRHESRPVRVPVVWPDPSTGCVYGGHCALLVRPDPQHRTCLHPPLQPRSPLPERRPPFDWRQPAGDYRPNRFAFASRSRYYPYIRNRN